MTFKAMKNFLLITCFFLTCMSSITAQDFEGIIEFKLQEGSKQETSVWYVKGDMVRIDEFEPGTRILKGCYLINTKENSAKYLDHTAKTWTSVIVTEEKRPMSTVEEVDSTLEFQSYKATKYNVKTDSLQMSYWLNHGKFGFFTPALTFIAHKNVYYKYYWHLPSTDNAMPMLVTKKNSAGVETGRLEVTRIDKRVIDANLFNVPVGYKQQ